MSAIPGPVNRGEPEAWEGLGGITAPTLLIGDGPPSHICLDTLAEATACSAQLADETMQRADRRARARWPTRPVGVQA